MRPVGRCFIYYSMSTWRTTMPVVMCIAISSAALLVVLTRLVPNATGLLSYDWGYFLPYLATGVGGMHLNGLGVVPHSTPNFCGGIPWLANPQSLFYSLPRFLALFFEPLTAIKLTTFICATIGATATYYALLRQCFRTSVYAAALGFARFQLNGFLLFRIVVGHLT